MSAIAPDKQEIIKELYSRRDSLNPDKRAIIEELASRAGISDAAPAPDRGTVSVDQAKAAFDAQRPGAVRTAADAIRDMMTGKGTAKAQQALTDAGTFAVNNRPSLRNTLRTGGAIGGGIIGAGAGAVTGPGAIATTAAGGAAGASIGESAYQIFDRLVRGGNDSPKTAEDALLAHGGAAVGGALQEGGGAVLGAGVSALSKRLMQRQVELILAPAGQAMKADVGEAAAALAENMPLAATRKGLLDKVNSKVDVLGKGVEDAYTSIRTNFPQLRVRSAPIVKALTDARDAYKVGGNTIPGLEGIVADYDKLINGIGSNPNLTVDEFKAIKRGWDEAINWSRNAQARTPAMEKALTTGANAIRDTLHTISPTLEKADSAYSLWKTAQNSLQNKVTAGVGVENFPIGKTLFAGTVGSGVGSALGAGPAEGAAAGEVLNALMSTTAYRTASVATKRAVDKAISEKATQKAIGLILAQSEGTAEDKFRQYMGK